MRSSKFDELVFDDNNASHVLYFIAITTHVRAQL